MPGFSTGNLCIKIKKCLCQIRYVIFIYNEFENNQSKNLKLDYQTNGDLAAWIRRHRFPHFTRFTSTNLHMALSSRKYFRNIFITIQVCIIMMNTTYPETEPIHD